MYLKIYQHIGGRVVLKLVHGERIILKNQNVCLYGSHQVVDLYPIRSLICKAVILSSDIFISYQKPSH